MSVGGPKHHLPSPNGKSTPPEITTFSYLLKHSIPNEM